MQVAAIRDANCPEMFFMELAALVSPIKINIKGMGNGPTGAAS